MLNVGKGVSMTWKAVGVYNKLTSRGSRYPHRNTRSGLELWYPESNAGDRSEAATAISLSGIRVWNRVKVGQVTSQLR